MNNRQIGALGEELALKYLLENGYELMEQNFRIKSGELDLIMTDPTGCMAIIEVKTDTSHHAGSPESWVTGKKIHQINKVAKIYVALHARDVQNIRFDVVSVVISDRKPQIKHIMNAFLPVSSSY